MIKITRHNAEDNERFMKRFKKSVERTGLLSELRQREFYDPQAERRRRERNRRKLEKEQQ
jgi:small subunit ribosomal protein S21